MKLHELHMLGLVLPGRYDVEFEDKQVSLPPLVFDGVGKNLFGRQVQAIVASGKDVETIEPVCEKAKQFWRGKKKPAPKPEVKAKSKNPPSEGSKKEPKRKSKTRRGKKRGDD